MDSKKFVVAFGIPLTAVLWDQWGKYSLEYISTKINYAISNVNLMPQELPQWFTTPYLVRSISW